MNLILEVARNLSCLVVLIGLLSCKPKINFDYTGPLDEWESYGGSAMGERYSKLNQITPENVKHLEVAWEYHTGDVSDGKGDIPSESAFEATPILVDNTLYFPTPFNRVIALDPETGEEKWAFDPKIDLQGHYANQLICRGVSYWKKEDCNADSCRAKIFTATNDARLIAIDARTGEKALNFGNNGEIDLNKGVGEQWWKGEYQVTSPPAIAGDVVIVGSAVSDNSRTFAPSGVVRAYNVYDGSMVWSWDLAPPRDSISDALKSDYGYMLSTPNVWAPMAVDKENDLLFIPTGNPTPDYYRGEGNDIDYYGSAVVAIKVSTGEVIWHYQTVHHDLWDFDVPCQPTLTTVQKDGRDVHVVIQATKMGLFFILDRFTGEPVFDIEERPVPQTNVPGETTSRTQPYPVKPLPLIRHNMTKEDIWGPLGLKGDCLKKFKEMDYEGAYTPPKVGVRTLMYPGNSGGSNWGGIAVDEQRQILISNVMDMPWIVTLFPAEEYEEWREKYPGVEIAPQEGTPYAMRREMFVSNLGLPCVKPPWGKLAAIDLSTGDLMWEQPFGTVRDLAPVPLKIKYGVPNLGGPIITASGLIFIAATMDNYIRAFNINTGKKLWEARLPAGGQATPMTYRIQETGKQYVVIAAGGHARAGTKLGDSVIAYALPDND